MKTRAAKWMSIVVVALAVGAAERPAHADFQIAIGTKWQPTNYTRPVGLSGGAAFVPLPSWQNTALNNFLGFFFMNGQLGFQLSLDLGWGATSSSVSGVNTTNDLGYTQFGFALGGKFHFNRPRANYVSPYLYLDLYKYFASMSTSDPSITNSQAGFAAGLFSPVGFNVAVGAEYFFTPAFSVGAEVFGFKFGYASAEMTENNVKTGASWTQIALYTGITLNYRFIIQGSVRVRQAEEGEEEESRPRRRRPPAQSEPPPSSPESVD